MNAPARINASEAAYFDGNHCAHVAARDEHERLRRRLAESHAAMLRAERKLGYMPFYDAIKAEERRTGRTGLPGDGGWAC